MASVHTQMAHGSTRIKKWREDPVQFVKDVFQVEPDVWQREVLKAFPRFKRLAMKACKGPGKTTVLSWLAWNFMATRPHPKIAATSISGDNLSDGLWTEMAKWRGKSAFLTAQFEWTKTRIYAKESPETWWMSARTWPQGADATRQADTLAGLHADYILFLLDESGGMPDAVMAAAEAALATGIECKIIQAGNPVAVEGPLYRACTSERHLWHVTEITSDPDDPARTPRVSKEWAKEQIEKYGRDNPWVLVNVFGKFPPSSMNVLLGPDEVQAAMGRQIHSVDYELAQKRLGVDVARFGNDRSVLFPRQGLRAFPFVEMRGARSNEVAARVSLAKANWHYEMEFVDGTGGYGSGVIDSLIQAGHSPQEIHFSGKAIDSRYFNKRAEIWFQMAEWVKRGGSLPKSDTLARELTAPLYTFHNGKFRLEEKEQIKARLGFSPDIADALALTFSWPEMPHSVSLPGMPQRNERLLHEYDPFEIA